MSTNREQFRYGERIFCCSVKFMAEANRFMKVFRVPLATLFPRAGVFLPHVEKHRVMEGRKRAVSKRQSIVELAGAKNAEKRPLTKLPFAIGWGLVSAERERIRTLDSVICGKTILDYY